MRTVSLCLAIAVLVASGCIRSYPLAPEELDRYWAVHTATAVREELYRPSIAGRKLPGRWIIRRQDSLILSTISIVKAGQQLEKDPEEIAFSVSPAHTQMVADMLARAAKTVRELGELVDNNRTKDPSQHVRLMARSLAGMEQLVREALPEEQYVRRGTEPLGMAVAPLLQMLTAYFNEQTGGALLEGLQPDDVSQLRQMLAQLVLRVGFATIGRQDLPGLRATVSQLMRKAENMALLERSIAEVLHQELQRAPPAPPGGQLPALIRTITTWTPRALRLLEALTRQWDRVDSVVLELRRVGDQPVPVITVQVSPGKEVRMIGVIIMQPTVVFRGRSRITILAKDPVTNEAVAMFDPVGDGSVDIRFEGLGYSLVRLFAFPLASGALREIRVFTEARKSGPQLVNVRVHMLVPQDKKDPRRVLAFQDIQEKTLQRDVFSVTSRTARRRTTVTYAMPGRRYTYQRLKDRPDD